MDSGVTRMRPLSIMATNQPASSSPTVCQADVVRDGANMEHDWAIVDAMWEEDDEDVVEVETSFTQTMGQGVDIRSSLSQSAEPTCIITLLKALVSTRWRKVVYPALLNMSDMQRISHSVIASALVASRRFGGKSLCHAQQLFLVPCHNADPQELGHNGANVGRDGADVGYNWVNVGRTGANIGPRLYI
jgi:hypothetical protein